MKAGPIDFWADIKAEILRNLPYDKCDAALDNTVKALPPPDLLIRFLNWRERLIHPHRRQVALSKEFVDNPLYASHRAALDTLLAKLNSGEDVTPHLSEQVLFGYLPRDPSKPFKHNRSLDLLLNDWGMHHLHISSDSGPRGFTKRSDEILIVIIRLNVVFVVDLVRHGEWSDQRLVEIAFRNWPQHGLFAQIRGILGIEATPSTDDRLRLRRAGVATAISVDGKVLIPARGGITTAGTSIWASTWAMNILNRLSAYEKDPQSLVTDFEANKTFCGATWPEVGDFHFRLIVTDKAFCEGIVEVNTNRALLLS